MESETTCGRSKYGKLFFLQKMKGEAI